VSASEYPERPVVDDRRDDGRERLLDFANRCCRDGDEGIRYTTRRCLDERKCVVDQYVLDKGDHDLYDRIQ
jgi:hypothetical protein